jgi:hypothetical protein
VLNGLVELQGEHALRGTLLTIGGLAGFAGFAFHQLRAAHPLLNMRLFQHQPFTMGAIVAFVYGVGLFGSTYLLPIYLQAALDFSPSKAGFIMLPAGLALALTMPVAGRLADKLRASRLVAAGVAGMAASLALMATVSAGTSVLVLMLWVIVGRIGIGTNRRPAGAKNARLFVTNRLARLAKKSLMIEINTGDDGTIGVEYVDRIKTTAQPHLEDNRVDRLSGEYEHRSKRAKFKIRQRDIAACQLDSFECGTQRGVINDGAADTHTLVVAQQMGRGVTTNTVAALREHRLEHGAARSLAVGTANRNDRTNGIDAQREAHRLHALEAEGDRLRMQLLQIGEPLR